MEIYLKYLNFQWLIVINIAVMYNLIFVIGENILNINQLMLGKHFRIFLIHQSWELLNGGYRD